MLVQVAPTGMASSLGHCICMMSATHKPDSLPCDLFHPLLRLWPQERWLCQHELRTSVNLQI